MRIICLSPTPTLPYDTVRNQNNETVIMRILLYFPLDRGNISIDFYISTIYRTGSIKYFNSLMCNLFTNIDLRSVLHEGSIWSVLTVVVLLIWRGRASGSGQTLSTPQLLTLLTFSLQRQYRHVYSGPSILFQHCSDVNRTSRSLHLLEPSRLQMVL